MTISKYYNETYSPAAVCCFCSPLDLSFPKKKAKRVENTNGIHTKDKEVREKKETEGKQKKRISPILSLSINV